MKLPSGRNSRGQAMVEFALVIPIFVLLLVGIFDLGRAVYSYHTLNNAAREGGRHAIVDQYVDHIRDRAADHAVALGVQADDVYVDFRRASTPDVPDSCDAEVGGQKVVGCLAVVRVPYTYTAATPIIGNIVGAIQMAGETRFRVGYNCADPSCPLGD